MDYLCTRGYKDHCDITRVKLKYTIHSLYIYISHHVLDSLCFHSVSVFPDSTDKYDTFPLNHQPMLV